jgi:hypothetical protein
MATTGITAAVDPLVGNQTGTESSLSSWAGDYVTNMLGKGQALSETPYQAYTGPLTAGASGLQNQAFGTASNLQTPASIGAATGIAGNVVNQYLGSNYDPTQFTSQYTAPDAYQTGQFGTETFGTQQAQQYMNPYLQSALNPQLDEARRQAQISRMGDAARLSQAGAYGGSRQAIMESELNRNLMSKQADITGIGYNTAYDKAAQQFNADQARQQAVQQATEQSRQFGYGQNMNAAQLGAQYGLAGQQAAEQSKQYGADFGLKGLQGAMSGAQLMGGLGAQQSQADLANLNTQATLGGVQRGIESEGIAADYGQFKEERDYPFKQVQYQQSLLQGMPLAAQSYSYAEPSALSSTLSSAGGVKALYDSLFGPKTTT